MTSKVVQKTGEMILSEYDRRLRQEEYKEGRVKRTEEGTYELQIGTIKYLRRTIRMPDGRMCKPLDKLLGFDRYSRRSQQTKEQICVLATDTTYRKVAIFESHITGRAISPSTVCWTVKEVGEADQLTRCSIRGG